jgi:hypothetical protein
VISQSCAVSLVMGKLSLSVSLSCGPAQLSLPTLAGTQKRRQTWSGVAARLQALWRYLLAASELLPLWLVGSYVRPTALGEAACGLFEKAGGSVWISNRL